MLKKDLRLKKTKDFSYIYRKGTKFKGQYISIYKLRSYSSIKIGFSLSRKTGKAVTRNLYRRRLQAIFKDQLDNLKPNKYVVISNSNISQASYEDLKKEALNLIEKMNSKLTQGDSHE